tara:strand:- start:7388 stop:7750 length:363 start_codon:yes stop_codon:yes gene_type:complete
MTNATLTLFISQSLRPDSERFRGNYFQGIDLTSRVTAEIVPVMVSTGLATFDASTGLTPVAGQEDEPIDDGRTAEGIMPLKNSEFCTLVNSFMSITAGIAADQSLVDAMSNACVRPITVN